MHESRMYYLNKAKIKKDDDFYTRYEDIENELSQYDICDDCLDVLFGGCGCLKCNGQCECLKFNFVDKIVYCNCDDYRKSNFVKYFLINFNAIGLKKLIATNYSEEVDAYHFEVNAVDDRYIDYSVGDYRVNINGILKNSANFAKKIKGNGSYDSDYCLDLLNKCDVVVTNPPFSKISGIVNGKETESGFYNVLSKSGKKFIIIVPKEALRYLNRYCSIFSDLIDDKIFVGNGIKKFNKIDKKGNVVIKQVDCYFINNIKRIELNKYSRMLFPTYKKFDIKYQGYTNDNYNYTLLKNKYKGEDIIYLNSVRDIPYQYEHYMLVPDNILTMDFYKYLDVFEVVKPSNLGFYKNDFSKFYNRIIVKVKDWVRDMVNMMELVKQ